LKIVGAVYSEAELRDEVVPRVAEVALQAEQTFVITNNHKDGQSVINAAQLQKLREVPVPDEVPELVRDRGGQHAEVRRAA
jgi:uncharacterized protein YecE (DUF72 family)